MNYVLIWVVVIVAAGLAHLMNVVVDGPASRGRDYTLVVLCAAFILLFVLTPLALEGLSS